MENCVAGHFDNNGAMVANVFMESHGDFQTYTCPGQNGDFTGFVGTVTVQCVDGDFAVQSGGCDANCAAGHIMSNGAQLANDFMLSGTGSTGTCQDGYYASPNAAGVSISCNDGVVSIADGESCQDVKECDMAQYAGQCDANATCVNTPGSWHCECNENYVSVGTGAPGTQCAWHCPAGSIPAGKTTLNYGAMNSGDTIVKGCGAGFTGEVTIECTPNTGRGFIIAGECLKNCEGGDFVSNTVPLSYGAMVSGHSQADACHGNYTGLVTFTCTDGVISDDGRCEENCSANTVLDNGATVKAPPLAHGSHASIACGIGYSGTLKFGCRDGVSYYESVCIKNCNGTEYELYGINVAFGEIFSGNHLAVTCPAGYTGTFTLYCEDDVLTLVQSKNYCEKNCGSGQMDINGAIVQYNPMNSGDQSTVACPTGFVGNVTFSCSKDVVTHTSGTCGANCPAGIIHSGHAEVNYNGVAHHGSATVSCGPGFTGSLDLSCNDGQISNDSAEQCKANCAGGHDKVNGADINFSQMVTGESQQISCGANFTGDVVVSCNDRVVSMAGNCYANCSTGAASPMPGAVPIGYPDMNSGATAAGTCPAGYKPRTTVSASCDDGQVTVSGVCEDIDECGSPGVCPSNSVCKNLVGTHMCTCNTGYYKATDDHCVECNEALSGDGSDYRGCQTVTRSGLSCKKWTDSHSDYNDVGPNNMCRNPDNDPNGIWCWTCVGPACGSSATDPWAYCDPLPGPSTTTTTTTTTTTKAVCNDNHGSCVLVGHLANVCSFPWIAEICPIACNFCPCETDSDCDIIDYPTGYIPVSPPQCGANRRCKTWVPPETCSDGITNNEETGTDCGGPNCDPCELYIWFIGKAPAQSQCDTSCGHMAPFEITGQVLCVNENTGTEVAAHHCTPPAPAAASTTCPATTACETFSWVALPVTQACRTDCGTPEEVIEGRVVCRSDQRTEGDFQGRCTGTAPAPRLKTCPAQPACTTTPSPAVFQWVAKEPVESDCPTVCGQPASKVSGAVICENMSGDSEGSGMAHCAGQVPSPITIDCPPTSACHSCDDKIQNGDETGVDCGGADCGACCTDSNLNCSSYENLCHYKVIKEQECKMTCRFCTPNEGITKVNLVVPLYQYPASCDGDGHMINDPWGVVNQTARGNWDIHFYVIINPNNGHDYDKFNVDWEEGLNGFKDNGKYLSNVTMLGYIDMEAASSTQANIDAYTSQIFQLALGDVWKLHGVAFFNIGSLSSQKLSVYQSFISTVKSIKPDAFILLATGNQFGVDEQWLTDADMVVSYINTYEHYKLQNATGNILSYPTNVRNKWGALLYEAGSHICPSSVTVNQLSTQFGNIFIAEDMFWNCDVARSLVCVTEAAVQHNRGR
jgi:hypothetical protein